LKLASVIRPKIHPRHRRNPVVLCKTTLTF